jgi:hypothetical protein
MNPVRTLLVYVAPGGSPGEFCNEQLVVGVDVRSQVIEDLHGGSVGHNQPRRVKMVQIVQIGALTLEGIDELQASLSGPSPAKFVAVATDTVGD